MLLGWLAGIALSGMILGSMLGLAGLFCGVLAGLWWAMWNPGRSDPDEAADYDDVAVNPERGPPSP